MGRGRKKVGAVVVKTEVIVREEEEEEVRDVRRRRGRSRSTKKVVEEVDTAAAEGKIRPKTEVGEVEDGGDSRVAENEKEKEVPAKDSSGGGRRSKLGSGAVSLQDKIEEQRAVVRNEAATIAVLNRLTSILGSESTFGDALAADFDVIRLINEEKEDEGLPKAIEEEERLRIRPQQPPVQKETFSTIDASDLGKLLEDAETQFIGNEEDACNVADVAGTKAGDSGNGITEQPREKLPPSALPKVKAKRGRPPKVPKGDKSGPPAAPGSKTSSSKRSGSNPTGDKENVENPTIPPPAAFIVPDPTLVNGLLSIDLSNVKVGADPTGPPVEVDPSACDEKSITNQLPTSASSGLPATATSTPGLDVKIKKQRKPKKKQEGECEEGSKSKKTVKRTKRLSKQQNQVSKDKELLDGAEMSDTSRSPFKMPSVKRGRKSVAGGPGPSSSSNATPGTSGGGTQSAKQHTTVRQSFTYSGISDWNFETDEPLNPEDLVGFENIEILDSALLEAQGFRWDWECNVN